MTRARVRSKGLVVTRFIKLQGWTVPAAGGGRTEMENRDAEPPTRVGHTILLQKVLVPGQTGGWFRVDLPLLAEAGALIWMDADELLVEHPSGEITRHSGQWLEPREGSRPDLVIDIEGSDGRPHMP